MKKTAMLLVLTGALGITSAAQASLLLRPGGMVYDDVLNITWLQDANYAKTSGYDPDGRMSWADAMAWADNLVYEGYGDWRLPTTAQPDPTCDLHSGGGYGYGYNCRGSELGYMFYTNLGGIAGTAISAHHNSNYNLFSDIRDYFYWSSTEGPVLPDGTTAWSFSFGDGVQYANYKQLYNYTFYAWAVRVGDIPEPATGLLFGAGAVGLGLSRRWGRRRR